MSCNQLLPCQMSEGEMQQAKQIRNSLWNYFLVCKEPAAARRRAKSRLERGKGITALGHAAPPQHRGRSQTLQLMAMPAYSNPHPRGWCGSAGDAARMDKVGEYGDGYVRARSNQRVATGWLVAPVSPSPLRISRDKDAIVDMLCSVYQGPRCPAGKRCCVT